MNDVKNIEIEKKFLIKKPSADFISSVPQGDVSEITQTYLKSDGCSTARVRKRAFSDKISYTKTVKVRISDMSAFEDEHEISEVEYLRALENADPERKPIEKRRVLLRHCGHIFEIDIYPFWQKQAVMEVELASEDEKFELPPEIEIIADVSGDKRYKNAALARGVYPAE